MIEKSLILLCLPSFSAGCTPAREPTYVKKALFFLFQACSCPEVGSRGNHNH